jgi:outer membrane cobalamin receptor
VTVTSDSTAMRTSIDRRSYSVANDLTAKTGSIADALRNIPSVEVDVQGNVSLRGDPNVTIMIDGKPSSMFNGDGKADALQQMPADQIDRVEVMTNPSAAYRPDGTAGIINLITKKTRKPGATGSFKLNVGPNSRYNTGVTGNLVKGKLTLSGDAGYRYDRQKFWSTDERETTPLVGAPAHTVQDGAFVNDGSAVNLRGGLDYNLTPKDRLSGEVRFRRMDYDADGEESFTDLTASPTAPVYTRASSAGMKRDNTVVSGDWRHQFKGSEHELDAHLEYEVTDFQRDGTAFIDNAAVADVYETFGFGSDQDRVNFKLDYTRPMPDEAKLKTGLDFEVVDNDYDNHGSTGPTAADQTVDPRRTNRFLYSQDVYAGYVTYERPFGDFTVLGGLRAEQVEIRTNQVTTGQKDDNSYFHVYPSLHLGYTLSQTQTLTANYSKRVQRPQSQDLNPYPIYQDPKNFFAGNPDLKPQITDSYELGWQYRKGPPRTWPRLYYRESRDGVTSVVREPRRRRLPDHPREPGQEPQRRAGTGGQRQADPQAQLQCQRQRLLERDPVHHPGRGGHARGHDPDRPRQPQLAGHAQGLLPAERLHLGQAPDAAGLSRAAVDAEPGLSPQGQRQAELRGHGQRRAEVVQGQRDPRHPDPAAARRAPGRRAGGVLRLHLRPGRRQGAARAVRLRLGRRRRLAAISAYSGPPGSWRGPGRRRPAGGHLPGRWPRSGRGPRAGSCRAG